MNPVIRKRVTGMIFPHVHNTLRTILYTRDNIYHCYMQQKLCSTIITKVLDYKWRQRIHPGG